MLIHPRFLDRTRARIISAPHPQMPISGTTKTIVERAIEPRSTSAMIGDKSRSVTAGIAHASFDPLAERKVRSGVLIIPPRLFVAIQRRHSRQMDNALS